MDLAALYQRSIDGFEARVAQVRPDQWTAPTPCPGWDVRALVNHVIGAERRAVPLLDGATAREIDDRFAGDLLGDDPRARCAEAAREARAAVSVPGAMRRMVHLSTGDIPAEEYLHQLLSEHVVHSWDLAVATGSELHLDPDAVHAVTRWLAEREDVLRVSGVISAPVAVPDCASEQDQLIGAFGRDPHRG
ncbi:TIGR03086 family metal-binding protein [Rugosimonospora acidiphila]|uniref:TIGR03086 family metal-binding protein n=1 Tax=Rugosimonospora acidiphila TaxID=556531 RepID=A0ABP9SHM0_9ACTN